MKDATGELSMTAVAVVAIAGVAALFSFVIWPTIRGNITRSAKCSQAFNCVDCDGSTCKCSYCGDDACSNPQPVTCPDQSGTNNSGGQQQTEKPA